MRVEKQIQRLTTEQAISELQKDSVWDSIASDCYLDEPLLGAAQRFADSLEWQATREFFPKVRTRAVELGAGRGVASFALAKDGWDVSAVEPDPSLQVGLGALLELADQTGLPITGHATVAEKTGLPSSSFDLVYERQVLHHVSSLDEACSEAARLLKPGGVFVCAREHVISKADDLNVFLNTHPLHVYTGAEHAYMLETYLKAFRESGLRVQRVLGPYDSPMNYYPMTRTEWLKFVRAPMSKRVGERLTRWLTNERMAVGRFALKKLAERESQRNSTPGRVYSFIARRPL